jgi:hypothetical protein
MRHYWKWAKRAVLRIRVLIRLQPKISKRIGIRIRIMLLVNCGNQSRKKTMNTNWYFSKFVIINFCIADPRCLSRIPDPDFFPSRIPDPKKHGEVKTNNYSVVIYYIFVLF